MSLSYIPYTKIDLLERLDLQTLNNAFEKLYVNDLFYSEIDKIAPKVFINNAVYNKGDCVWYNTEDPKEFVLKSNVHWRLIHSMIGEVGRKVQFDKAYKHDLFILSGSTNVPNIVSNGGTCPDIEWNELSSQYVSAISCAYDIGNIGDPVQIYQFQGETSQLNIPTNKVFKYSEQLNIIDNPDAPTRTFTDMSVYMDQSATISVENEYGEVEWITLLSGTYKLNPFTKKVPKLVYQKFYDHNWKPLLNSPVKKEDILTYVLWKINNHESVKDSEEYREHVIHDISSLSAFQDEYLQKDFSNIDDQVCQLNIPNLNSQASHNINTGFDYVYETVINGDKGYRLWKSGLLEHWGRVELTEDDLKSSNGLKINLNWNFDAPDGNMYRSSVYTYGLSNSVTTNTGVNSTANVYGDSTFLLADDNRYLVHYTWCNEGSESPYYKKLLGGDYTDNTDSNIINFTECNVYNVKNTSFVIPNVSYESDDGTVISHMHPVLYYYTSGFTRNINLNMKNRKVTKVVVNLEDCMLDASFDYNLKYNGKYQKPEFKLTKDGIIKVDATGLESTRYVEGYDYIYQYYDNLDSGTAHITVTGTSETLVGEKTFYFNILPIEGSETSAFFDPPSYPFSADEQEPDIQASYIIHSNVTGLDTRVYVPQSDMYVTYEYNYDVGQAVGYVQYTGRNITGSSGATFDIYPEDISCCQISSLNDGTEEREEGKKYGYYYRGTEIAPILSVYLNEVLMTNGKDYVLDYPNAINIGSYEVSVMGVNNLSGETVWKFDIVRSDISSQITETVAEQSDEKPILATWTRQSDNNVSRHDMVVSGSSEGGISTEYSDEQTDNMVTFSLKLNNRGVLMVPGVDYKVGADPDNANQLIVYGIGNYINYAYISKPADVTTGTVKSYVLNY